MVRAFCCKEFAGSTTTEFDECLADAERVYVDGRNVQ